MRAILKIINPVIAFTLAMCMLFGLGYWGYRNNSSPFLKYVFTIGLPLIAAILWGIFAAPKSKFRLVIPYRVLFKLTLFFITAFLIYLSGHLHLALLFATIAVLNEIKV